MFGRSIHYWQWGVKVLYDDCVAVDLLKVLQDFPYIFQCSNVGCICVYKGYIFLLDSSLKNYVVTFFAFVLKSILFDITIATPAFFHVHLLGIFFFTWEWYFQIMLFYTFKFWNRSKCANKWITNFLKIQQIYIMYWCRIIHCYINNNRMLFLLIVFEIVFELIVFMQYLEKLMQLLDSYW